MSVMPVPVVLGGFHASQTTNYDALYQSSGRAPESSIPVSDLSSQPDGKELLLLVTPTIIDPAGNPVHEGERK